MEIKEIQNLIKFVAKSGAHEVKLETDDFKITIKVNAESTSQEILTANQLIPNKATIISEPMQETVSPTKDLPNQKINETIPEESQNNLITIKSPMIGTFYRSANPESPAFANVGDKIEKGQTVCIVEAMKLFNEIESEVSGTIVKVMVENAQPVEYDQVLFLVDPS